MSNGSQQARKPRSYVSLKLRHTDRLTGTEVLTGLAKKKLL